MQIFQLHTVRTLHTVNLYNDIVVGFWFPMFLVSLGSTHTRGKVFFFVQGVARWRIFNLTNLHLC